MKKKDKGMQISFSQEMVINYVLKTKKAWSNEDPNKSYIISEKGGPQILGKGTMVFMGTFKAHLWHRGDYQFTTRILNIFGNDLLCYEFKKIS